MQSIIFTELALLLEFDEDIEEELLLTEEELLLTEELWELIELLLNEELDTELELLLPAAALLLLGTNTDGLAPLNESSIGELTRVDSSVKSLTWNGESPSLYIRILILSSYTSIFPHVIPSPS